MHKDLTRVKPLYEYVLSAPQFLRVATSIYQDRFDEIIAKGYEKIQSPFYDFSVLFNGWTEKRVADTVIQRVPHERVFVDSGGLQLATRNIKITPEIKREIYKTQTKGDVAMCFDEIPLHIGDFNKQHRSSTASKYFVENRAHASAVKTGENVNEQAQTFAEHDANTKIFLIAQGNEADDFARFLETQYEQIDADLHKYIGGVALADTCCGNGALESIEMIRGLMKTQLPDEVVKNVHILGVGTLGRMIPFIELKRSGAWDVERISFDSSTHSSAFAMGRIHDEDGKMKKISRSTSLEFLEFLETVYDMFFADFYPGKRMDYVQFVLQNSVTFSAKADALKNDVTEMMYLTYYFYVMLAVHRFMHSIEDVHNDQARYAHYIRRNKTLTGIQMISQCKTSDDIEKIKFDLKRVLKSNRISRLASLESANDLSSLFE